jgi:hypothetical protein
MNQRIKELENQCWSHRVDGRLVDGQLHFDTQKFAKLIGIKCLSIADSIRDECDKDGESQQALGAAWVGIAIARHFGVEDVDTQLRNRSTYFGNDL